MLDDRPLSHVTVMWKVEPVAGPWGGLIVSSEPVTVRCTSGTVTMVAAPDVGTDRYVQPTGGLFALLVIDTTSTPPSALNRSCGGGGGGGGGGTTTSGGSHTWVAAGRGAGAAATGCGGGGAAAGGGGGGGSHQSVAISEKFADVSVSVVVAGWPATDTTMPNSATNAAPARIVPSRRWANFDKCDMSKVCEARDHRSRVLDYPKSQHIPTRITV